MPVKIAVLAAYFMAVLSIGYLARSSWRSTPQSYFLADRALGPLVLLATMTATTFSAFTVFGASGAGYRDGWSFFPIMGFGTGFMALSFWMIGRRAWRVGKERRRIRRPAWLTDRCFWLPAAIFVLAMDFWAWERVQPVLLGLPLWVVYFVLLSALQTAAMGYLVRRSSRVDPA